MPFKMHKTVYYYYLLHLEEASAELIKFDDDIMSDIVLLEFHLF